MYLTFELSSSQKHELIYKISLMTSGNPVYAIVSGRTQKLECDCQKIGQLWCCEIAHDNCRLETTQSLYIIVNVDTV